DQWGNIITGIDLTRRVDAQEIYGLTSPLITTASGAKMGKSADGAIWLNEDRLSTFDFWQFWRNTEDADVARFLALFTELPMDEVARLGALEGAEVNEAKIILANEATTLCHGADAARAAMETAQQTFAGGGVGDGLPQETVSAEEADGLGMIAALVKVGFAKSNGEARRLIRGGGARLNDVPISDEGHLLSAADFSDGRAKISA
ncbi:MAG: tyrosine--tRNA ligase, partial [Rhodobiaceae bacterium]